MDMTSIKENIDPNVCVICGDSHFYGNCTYVKITKHVPDAEIPSKAKLTLPDFLKLQILTDGSYSVLTKTAIIEGTQFGPFIARKVTGNPDPSNVFPLKVFVEDNDNSEYYLDMTDENKCSWLVFISPAEQLEEQNLICYQDKEQIYYIAIKDIDIGDSLKVWYSPYYAHKMNKPLLTSGAAEQDTFKNVDINTLIKEQQKIVERNIWTCKFCSKEENSIVDFANHVRKHYVSQMMKQCEICKKQFILKRSLLRHLKIVHNDSNFTRQVTNQLNNSPNNSNSKDVALGGPLLNNIFTDSSDLPQNDDFAQFDLSMDNSNLLLDNDNLNMENLLSDNVKDFDHFDFEIDDSKKQFVCDICFKQFTKIKFLVRHLQHHTGDNTCFKCLKIFCRKENLKSHICNTESNYTCEMCNKRFNQRKYLSRHVESTHNEKYKCTNCCKSYYCNKELLEHNCSNVPSREKEKFNCPHCDREFYRQIYLKRHLQTHISKVNRSVKTSCICQTCGQYFENKNSYYLHQKKHKEPSYLCQICDKKFHTQDSLNGHLLCHQGSSEVVCPLCKKVFKTKKILRTHLNHHNNKKQYKCSKCTVEFKRVSNLNKHMKQIHPENDFKKYSIEFYSCPVCNKKVKLRSSLNRHLKKIHPNVKDINIANILPRISTTNILQTKREKVEKIATKTEPKKCDSENIDVVICERLESELDEHINKLLNNTETGLINLADKKAVENLVQELDNESMKGIREVCLSIPDLTEADQEITLDRNAYILENGTIVQPQDTDNVVLYVLDHAF